MGGTTVKKHPQETMVFRDLHIGSFHQIPLHGVSSCRSGRSVNFASFPIPGLERCEEHSEPERIETGIFTWPSRRSSSTVSVRPWRRQDIAGQSKRSSRSSPVCEVWRLRISLYSQKIHGFYMVLHDLPSKYREYHPESRNCGWLILCIIWL